MFLKQIGGFVSVLATVSMSQAAAQTVDTHWYMGGSYSYTRLNDSSSKLVRDDQDDAGFGLVFLDSGIDEERFDARFSRGNAFSIILGMENPDSQTRAEIEYRRGSDSIKSFGNDETGELFTGDLKSEMLFLNLWYGFPNIGFLADFRLTPYIGAGVGAARIDAGGDSDSVAIAQVGVGLSYEINSRFSVDMGYQLFRTAKLDFSLPEGDVESEYGGSSINLELRWYWNRED